MLFLFWVMYVYLVIVYFFILLLLCVQKKYWLPAIFVVSLYIVSLLASMYICIEDKTFRDQLSLIPSLLFCFLLTISFSPFFQKTPVIAVNKSKSFKSRFIISGLCVSLTLLAASVMLYTKIQEAFLVGVVDVRMDMYNDVETLTSYTTIEHIGHSAIRWLGGLVYCLLLMFFYALAYIPKHWLFKILLIISSLSYAYFGMLNGGRTHLLYWVIFFIFSACIFYNDIPKRERKWAFILIGVPLFVVLSLYLVSVSIGRADAAHMDTDSMVLQYMGYPYKNFCYFFDNCNFHPYTLRRIFPLTSSLLGVSTDLSEYREYIETHSGMNIGTFFTFMGDLYVDVGFIGLVTYVMVILGLLGNRCCKKKVISLSDILVIGIFARIVLHGLFYYSLYQRETSVSLIFTLILAYYLKEKDTNHNKVLNRVDYAA